MHHSIYAECISLITRNYNRKLPYLMFGWTYYHQFILLNWLSYKNTVVPLKVVEKYKPLGASTSLELKFLVFNTLKSYFIYFNTQFPNTSYINFLNFSISQTLFIYFIYLFSLFLSTTKPNKRHNIYKYIYIYIIPSYYSELLVLAVYCSKLPKKRRKKRRFRHHWCWALFGVWGGKIIAI